MRRIGRTSPSLVRLVAATCRYCWRRGATIDKLKMSDSLVVREIKALMIKNLRLVDELEAFCTRVLGAHGPCKECSVRKVLEPEIREILKKVDNKPQDPRFGGKIRLVFDSLNLTCGFWTFTQTPDGWIFQGAGFKQEHYPQTYDHPPVRIKFKGPFLIKSLRDICLDKTARIVEGIEGNKLKIKNLTNPIDLLDIPESLKTEVLGRGKEVSWTGVLWRNHDPIVSFSDFFATWDKDTTDDSNALTNMRLYPFSDALIAKVQIAHAVTGSG